jgi:hypothetical protein
LIIEYSPSSTASNRSVSEIRWDHSDGEIASPSLFTQAWNRMYQLVPGCTSLYQFARPDTLRKRKSRIISHLRILTRVFLGVVPNQETGLLRRPYGSSTYGPSGPSEPSVQATDSMMME